MLEKSHSLFDSPDDSKLYIRDHLGKNQFKCISKYHPNKFIKSDLFNVKENIDSKHATIFSLFGNGPNKM